MIRKFKTGEAIRETRQENFADSIPTHTSPVLYIERGNNPAGRDAGCTAVAQIGDDFDDVDIKLNADAELVSSMMPVKDDSKRAI